MTVDSSTNNLIFEKPPTKLFRPKLPSAFPPYNFTIPLGAVAAPLSETFISPPDAVFILLFFPAFNTIAPEYPVSSFTLDELETGSLRLISPVSVSIKTDPVE